MNERSDIERTLRLWMADPPATMPDRVVDVVAERIAVNRQRRVVRLPGRKAAMPSRTLSYLVGAAAVVAIAVAAVYLISRPSSTNVGGPTPAPSATRSSPASPGADTSATPWWNSQRRGAGQLAAGTHTSSYLQPTLAYAVPSGWVNDYDNPDGFELLPDIPENRSAAASGSQMYEGLVVDRNVRVAAADCSNRPEPGTGFAAKDIVDALATRPGVQATAPVPAAVGGLEGWQIDLVVPTQTTASCRDNGTPAVHTVQSGGVVWGLFSLEKSRYIVVNDPQMAGNVLVRIEADNATAFDRLLAAATPILESFRFTTGS